MYIDDIRTMDTNVDVGGGLISVVMLSDCEAKAFSRLVAAIKDPDQKPISLALAGFKAGKDWHVNVSVLSARFSCSAGDAPRIEARFRIVSEWGGDGTPVKEDLPMRAMDFTMVKPSILKDGAVRADSDMICSVDLSYAKGNIGHGAMADVAVLGLSGWSVHEDLGLNTLRIEMGGFKDEVSTAVKTVPFGTSRIGACRFEPPPAALSVEGCGMIMADMEPANFAEPKFYSPLHNNPCSLMDFTKRVHTVGSHERPATAEDIADVQRQLAEVCNDPNLTITTHGGCFDIKDLSLDLKAAYLEMLAQTAPSGPMDWEASWYSARICSLTFFKETFPVAYSGVLCSGMTMMSVVADHYPMAAEPVKEGDFLYINPDGTVRRS